MIRQTLAGKINYHGLARYHRIGASVQSYLYVRRPVIRF